MGCDNRSAALRFESHGTPVIVRAMSTTTLPPSGGPGRAPVVQGRVFVPLFVGALLLAVAGAVTMTLRVRPVAMSAKAKTFPLSAKLNAYCRVPGLPEAEDLHAAGRCQSRGSLVLSVGEAGTAAKYVGYAVVSDSATEPQMLGQFEVGKEQVLPLDARVVGAHTLVFFVAEKPVDLEEMKHALSIARPGDMGDALLRLEQFRTVLRRSDNDARIERLRFLVEG